MDRDHNAQSARILNGEGGQSFLLHGKTSSPGTPLQHYPY